MCCRYYMEDSPELRPFLEAMNRSPLGEKIVAKLGKPLTAAGEVSPTDIVPVVASNHNAAPTVFPMLWGFTNPRSASPIVNARVETAAEKTMFKESWRHHRCIIPASYYFEWERLVNPKTGAKKAGDKYLIQPTGSPILYLAGLYRMEQRDGITIPVFAVLTREPADNIRFIHDRMPVILPKNLIRPWVNPDEKPEQIIGEAITDMMFQKAIA